MVNVVFSIPLGVADATDVAAAHLPPARRAGGPLLLREFIAGPENGLVRIAAQDVLQGKTGYDPLVLYGPTGTGKTLLVRSLARQWQRKYPKRGIVIVTGADFAREYAEAVRNDTLSEMRRRHRQAALFVLDDLQQLASKRAAQDELARTLDTIADCRGRVIVTSHRPPAEMTLLTARLTSRLAAGLAVPVSPPGVEARRVILARLTVAHGIELPKRVMQILADELPLVVPHLHAAVLELVASSRNGEKAIDVRRVRAYVASRTSGEPPTLRTITAMVAKYFEVKVGDLKGPTRRQAIVRPRAVAMFLARAFTDKSYKQVGRHFGGRDHTTVMHACQKTEELMKTDPATRQAVNELSNLLRVPCC